MAKKRMRRPVTTVSQIKGALRLLTMRCRERAQALKDCNRTCSKCGRKHSAAKGKECKVQEHHAKRPDWKRLESAVREELLDGPWVPLCEECHEEEHQGDELRFRKKGEGK